MANFSAPQKSDHEDWEKKSRPEILPGDAISDPLDGPVKLHRLAGMLADRISIGVSRDSTDLLSRILEHTPEPGEDPSDAVAPLQSLIRVCLHHSAYDVVDPLLIRVIELKEQQNPDSAEIATLVASLAKVRYTLGDHESAEDLSRYVLEIRERLLAPNHFGIVTALEHLADACSARGKLDEAVALFDRARTIRRINLGSEHESIKVASNRIADLQFQIEQSLEVEPPRIRSQPIQALLANHPAPSSNTAVPHPRAALTADVFLKRTLPSAEKPRSRAESPARSIAASGEKTQPEGAMAAFYSNMLMQIGRQTDVEAGGKSNELAERVLALANSAGEFARAHYKPLVLGAFVLMLAVLAYSAAASRPEPGRWTTDEQYQQVSPPAAAPMRGISGTKGVAVPPGAAAGVVLGAIVPAPPSVDPTRPAVTVKPKKKSSSAGKKKAKRRRVTRTNNVEEARGADEARNWSVTIPCRYRGPDGCISGEGAANLDSIVGAIQTRVDARGRQSSSR
jgi:tetratricopeptide (TPR) repeat protein